MQQMQNQFIAALNFWIKRKSYHALLKKQNKTKKTL